MDESTEKQDFSKLPPPPSGDVSHLPSPPSGDVSHLPPPPSGDVSDQTPPPAGPLFDPDRQRWVFWEDATKSWLEFVEPTQQWIPVSKAEPNWGTIIVHALALMMCFVPGLVWLLVDKEMTTRSRWKAFGVWAGILAVLGLLALLGGGNSSGG